jgi:hypothetical protein
VLHGLFDEHGAHCGAANVAHQCESFGADGVDLSLRCRRNGAGAVDGNTGTGLSKSNCNRSAEAARGTGDERRFALEAELVEY